MQIDLLYLCAGLFVLAIFIAVFCLAQFLTWTRDRIMWLEITSERVGERSLVEEDEE